MNNMSSSSRARRLFHSGLTPTISCRSLCSRGQPVGSPGSVASGRSQMNSLRASQPEGDAFCKDFFNLAEKCRSCNRNGFKKFFFSFFCTSNFCVLILLHRLLKAVGIFTASPLYEHSCYDWKFFAKIIQLRHKKFSFLYYHL